MAGIRKVLLTGGAGFVGYHLTKRLQAQNCEVVIYDNFTNYVPVEKSCYHPHLQTRLNNLKKDICIVRGDIRDRSSLQQVVREHAPDAVVHLAAVPITKAANQFTDETIAINLDGTINLLECLRSASRPCRLLYVSSSCVYGDFAYEPADELHPTQPIDVYGGTKLSGEILTRAYGCRFGIEQVIVRPSAVYGPTDCNRRVVQIMIENALQGKPLVLHNAGLDRVDFTYVKDAVNGISLALTSPLAVNETFNITAGEGKSVNDLVQVLRQRFPDLQAVEKPQDERRPNRGTLGIAKAQNILQYLPEYNLEKGVNEYIDFILAHQQQTQPGR